jgi:hypothetical protein
MRLLSGTEQRLSGLSFRTIYGRWYWSQAHGVLRRFDHVHGDGGPNCLPICRDVHWFSVILLCCAIDLVHNQCLDAASSLVLELPSLVSSMFRKTRLRSIPDCSSIQPMLVIMTELSYPKYRAPLTLAYNSLWYSGAIMLVSSFRRFLTSLLVQRCLVNLRNFQDQVDMGVACPFVTAGIAIRYPSYFCLVRPRITPLFAQQREGGGGPENSGILSCR